VFSQSSWVDTLTADVIVSEDRIFKDVVEVK
jgi:hypothetical protein